MKNNYKGTSELYLHPNTDQNPSFYGDVAKPEKKVKNRQPQVPQRIYHKEGSGFSINELLLKEGLYALFIIFFWRAWQSHVQAKINNFR